MSFRKPPVPTPRRSAACWFSAIAVAAPAMAALPASAQTTPGSDVPALLTPAVPNNPFDKFSVSPGNPLRSPTVRGALPAIPDLGQPLPTDGKIQLDLVARFAKDGPEIRSGVKWRIFHDEADQNGDLPLAEDSDVAAPQFRLNPGKYVIHATYGLASASQHVDLEGNAERHIVRDLDLRAGALKLLAVVEEAPIDPRRITFQMTSTEGGLSREMSETFRPGQVVRLPAGPYHVVSTFGDANAVVEVDLRVEPGKLLEATVHHKAATVALRLLEGKDAPPLGNTSWSVLTPGGDVVRESIESQPDLVLAEGKYLAIGRHDGRSYSQTFTVDAGTDQKIEIVRSEATAVPDRPSGQNEAPADGEGSIDQE